MNDDERELVRARLKKYVEMLPPEERKRPTLMRMNGAILTPEDQLREVEMGTRMGRVIEEAEAKMLERVREKAREAGMRT